MNVIEAMLLCSTNLNKIGGFSMAIVKRLQAADRQRQGLYQKKGHRLSILCDIMSDSASVHIIVGYVGPYGAHLQDGSENSVYT